MCEVVVVSLSSILKASVLRNQSIEIFYEKSYWRKTKIKDN